MNLSPHEMLFVLWICFQRHASKNAHKTKSKVLALKETNLKMCMNDVLEVSGKKSGLGYSYQLSEEGFACPLQALHKLFSVRKAV